MATTVLKFFQAAPRLHRLSLTAVKFTAPARSLSLQEYQSKQLLKDYGINIQRFEVVSTKEEVGKAVQDLNKQCGKVKEYVIKAQILAGGGCFLGRVIKWDLD